MLTTFKDRFGAATVISVIALVFAMLGGAYAATGDGGSDRATASAKKASKGLTRAQVIALIKKNAATGPQGPKGDPGAAGAPGAKGDTGNPWTAGGTLPDGQSSTGTWGTSGGRDVAGASDFSMVPISFPLPLSSAPDLYYVIEGGGFALKALAGAFEPVEEPEEVKAVCPGTAALPTAEPGNLCMYAAIEEGAGPNTNKPTLWEVPHVFGVVVPFKFVTGGTGETYAKGSWAVAAP